MKQTIIITANPDHASATLYGYYADKDKNPVYIIAEPWDLVVGALPNNKKVFKYPFNPKYNNTRCIIEWDWGKDTPAMVIDRQKKVKEALMMHPHIEGVGYTNKRLVLNMFKMEIVEDVEKKNFEMSKIYLEVTNLVDKMSTQAKRDLVYFFGGNPSQMSEHQVWMDLIGPGVGRLLNENNASLFMKSIKAEQKDEVSMRICIKKSIQWGIVETRDNKYFSGQNDLLGLNEDDVYMYYIGHPELFDYVKSEVKKRENETLGYGNEEETKKSKNQDKVTVK